MRQLRLSEREKFKCTLSAKHCAYQFKSASCSSSADFRPFWHSMQLPFFSLWISPWSTPCETFWLQTFQEGYCTSDIAVRRIKSINTYVHTHTDIYMWNIFDMYIYIYICMWFLNRYDIYIYYMICVYIHKYVYTYYVIHDTYLYIDTFDMYMYIYYMYMICIHAHLIYRCDIYIFIYVHDMYVYTFGI